MPITELHPLVVDIVRIFRVSPSFVLAYMARQNFESLSEKNSWAEFSRSLTPLQFMYVEFAFTCVLRARQVIETIEKYLISAGTGLRYLDVGCGYGGFVKEFAERGYEAVGVELQEHLAAFSRENCRGLSNTHIVNEDFLTGDAGRLGRFDLITCNDVIEHVADPRDAMIRMVSMLRGEGVLFMEIPNRDCIDSVVKDGHFQQFGLTQLERNAAHRYLASTTGQTNYLEEMGELYELEYYKSILRSAGCTVEVVQNHRTGSIEDVPSMASRLAAEFDCWCSIHASKADAHLVHYFTQRLSRYQAQLWSDFERVQRGVAREQFELKYLNSFWSVVARRSS